MAKNKLLKIAIGIVSIITSSVFVYSTIRRDEEIVEDDGSDIKEKNIKEEDTIKYEDIVKKEEREEVKTEQPVEQETAK